MWYKEKNRKKTELRVYIHYTRTILSQVFTKPVVDQLISKPDFFTMSGCISLEIFKYFYFNIK